MMYGTDQTTRVWNRERGEKIRQQKRQLIGLEVILEWRDREIDQLKKDVKRLLNQVERDDNCHYIQHKIIESQTNEIKQLKAEIERLKGEQTDHNTCGNCDLWSSVDCFYYHRGLFRSNNGKACTQWEPIQEKE